MPFNTALTRKLGIKSITTLHSITHTSIGLTNNPQSPLSREA